MKRGLFIIALVIFMTFVVSAAECNLEATLINQDPYPAIPGDYVKVVFQLGGVSNPECGLVDFKVVSKFPFSLDPGVEDSVQINSGTYARNFESSLVLPFRLRVDAQALDGENEVEVTYNSNKGDGQVFQLLKNFNISIEGIDIDFEVYVSDFDLATNELSFELLNIGEDDAEAVVFRIPKQDVIQVKGGNFVILGDLDSQEETNAQFEAVASEGEIVVEIVYTDRIGERRTLTKKVYYDPTYFTGRKKDEKKPLSVWVYVVGALVLIWIVLYVRRRMKKKRDKMNRR